MCITSFQVNRRLMFSLMICLDHLYALWRPLGPPLACRVEVLVRTMPSKVQIGPTPYYLTPFVLFPPTRIDLAKCSCQAIASYFLSRNLSLLIAPKKFFPLPSFSPWGWPSPRQAELSCFSFILTLWSGQCASSTWQILVIKWWEQTELHMELLATNIRNSHTHMQ